MFTDDRILKLAADVKEGKAKYQALKDSNKYSVNHLWKVRQELETAFKNDLQNYYDSELEKNRAIQEELKQTYAKKAGPSPEAATLELLRRQNINMKLELSSDEDLKEAVNIFKKTGEGDLTELNMLRLELRKRKLDREEVTVKAYMDEYNISTPYMQDEKYRKAQERIMLIGQARRTGLIHLGKGDSKEVISLKISQ
jgi:hypothetical protein